MRTNEASSDLEHKRYKIGIDVGTNSVGLAAIEIDDADNPISLLNMEVFTHDAGVDPSKRKEAQTRRAVSGVARRTRRLNRRRTERLKKLDRWISDQGWPVTDPQTLDNPYSAWEARARLAKDPRVSPDEFAEMISLSLRHMARHRGWRSPYAKVETLFRDTKHSDQYIGFRDSVENSTVYIAPEDATPAEILVDSGALRNKKIRGPKGVLGGKLMQSDNANELRRIGAAQGLEDTLVEDMIRVVFEAKSPVGSAADRVGKDALPGQGDKPRASRASLVFQRFRVVSVLTNIRITDDGNTRALTRDELRVATDFLLSDKVSKGDSDWSDVAEVLGFERHQLRGTASLGPEGERASARPPINDVSRRVQESKIKSLVKWWSNAGDIERSALIEYLDNVTVELADEEAEASVLELISGFSEEDMEKLEKLTLPSGRSAYSEDSLERLTNVMLESGVDLFTARKTEFGVADDWLPPADRIGEPVGNPAVDRVLKIVARWLLATERRWGAPKSVNIEHVRAGFLSESASRDIERSGNRRFEQNQKTFDEMSKQLGIVTSNRSDLARYLAIQRQHCSCAYCGETITFASAEMDHIVPRAGAGSTNTRNNLTAVCRACNQSKGKQLFSKWAGSNNERGVVLSKVIGNVNLWDRDPGQSSKDLEKFKREVITRLRQTHEDDPIDSRSIESVAWMARELRSRIEGHFKSQGGEGSANTDVRVYRGSVTHDARHASGLEKQIHLIGGEGKTRLDRRHHAVDAAVIALMRDSVAKTLAERSSMRQSEWATREPNGWREYKGSDFGNRSIYSSWLDHMKLALELVNEALDSDQVPVMTNTRLRLGNGRAHEDQVQKLMRKPLSEAFSLSEVDRASTPALWCALTRNPDFDEKKGLPENPQRRLVVNGCVISSNEEVELFGSGAAAIKVRGGYCELGDSVHHARIYRIEGETPRYAMLRVYAADLRRANNQDLFDVPIPEQSISMRTASGILRKALKKGMATYQGWLVRGDEITVASSLLSGSLPGEFVDSYPNVRSWKIDGFYDSRRLRLRPTLLAAEGLSDDTEPAVRKTLDSPGWLASISKVFGDSGTAVVRRNVLGEPRSSSNAGLPISWSTAR
ncbi:MAG: type II CRISPR RNA-guided endonuclease Cas9 [Scrofimicrobium sp.]